MIGRRHHVVIDCPDPAGLADFYSELLGLPVTFRSADWVVVAENHTASGLAFQLAPDHQPPQWPNPARPQQLHLDVMVDDVQRAASEVLALGARRVSDDQVFADPAGHPFCLVPRPGWAPPIGTDARRYLEAYDDQLRTDAETPSALSVTTLGPLRLVTFPEGRGFVTYRDLAEADAGTISGWVDQVLAHYLEDPDITRVEWKTRGHDRAPGLHEALVARGFVPEEPESIMIGEARLLDVDVPLPDGVSLRRVSSEADVRAMSAMQDEAFGDRVSDQMADALLRRLATGDGMELWVAEAEGRIVSAGRLEPVAGTDFAGIWGRCNAPAVAGRGIYRALTAARARSALAMGKTLIQSDSTEYSRPILERSGLVRVSTTTPYQWQRRR